MQMSIVSIIKKRGVGEVGWAPVSDLRSMETSASVILATTNPFTITKHMSHLLLTFPSRPALYTSYYPTSWPSRPREDSGGSEASFKHYTHLTSVKIQISSEWAAVIYHIYSTYNLFTTFRKNYLSGLSKVTLRFCGICVPNPSTPKKLSIFDCNSNPPPPPPKCLGSLNFFLSSFYRNTVIGAALFLHFLEHSAVSLGDLFELSNILRATVICFCVGATSRICVIRSMEPEKWEIRVNFSLPSLLSEDLKAFLLWDVFVEGRTG